MRLDPLLTASPETGAIRPVTDDLLREVYLAPRPAPFPLAEAAAAARGAPWAASLAAAPDETLAAVEAALQSVMRATPGLDPAAVPAEALPEGRARTHLAALRGLWQDLGALPPPLDTIAHLLAADAADALEPLPLLDPAPCPFADAAETVLAGCLLRHHGAAPDGALRDWQARQAPSEGTAAGALGAVQRGLGRTGEAAAPDDTLRVFGLRDPREEAEFAAALAQRMLDDGTVGDPREIGLLAPDDPAYAALPEAFARVGVPLSDRVTEAPCRDAAGELLAGLMAVFEGPPPAMALASLALNPLMPWPQETACRIARECMDRGWSRTTRELDGSARRILDALRPATSAAQLVARLRTIDRALPGRPLAARVAGIAALATDPLDWPALRRAAGPRGPTDPAVERSVEGVSVFAATALPWRPVRRLIVLGLAGQNWPRPPGNNPFFTEAEIGRIRAATGLALPSRQARLGRGLALFRRQIAAATEGAALLAPARDLAGDRLSPSIALSLVAHQLGAAKPEAVVEDIRRARPARWPVHPHMPRPVPRGGAPALPRSGTVSLQTDLFRVRASAGTPHPAQSPSRLETLLVSPLGWLLRELGAEDRTWGPATLDILLLGQLVHGVLERVFPAEAPVPDDDAIGRRAAAALAEAIAGDAPWLDGIAWTTERASLLREATATAKAWGRFLRGCGAAVLANEVRLDGEHGGLVLTGVADCLLRLPDGRVMVVDHKRSSSAGRRDRMKAGWDLQVALYRAMLERPAAETPLTALAAGGAPIVTAYHTTRDGTVLTDPAGAGIPGAEAAEGEVSAAAMARLAEAAAEMGDGTVVLNREGDAARLLKDCGITAYALEDPFVAAFTMPGEDAE